MTRYLRAQATGDYPSEAAAELLIRHGSWLLRTEFKQFIDYLDDPEATGRPRAAVNWPRAIAALEAGEWAARGSEQVIVRLVASLDAGLPVDLRQLSRLGQASSSLVAAAVRHCAGYPQAWEER